MPQHKQPAHYVHGLQRKDSSERFDYAQLVKERNLIVCKLDDGQPFEVPIGTLKSAEEWDGSEAECTDLIDGGYGVMVRFKSGAHIDFAADFALRAAHGDGAVDFGEIGQRIKGWREKKGMTLAQVAKVTKIAESNLSRLEHGRVTPMIPTLQKLAKAFGISPGELIRG